jgi:TetR/AcrR family transcriptional regulator
VKKNAARNPRQSQARILEAALKEFAAKGLDGARVDSIARRARINKRMLYHYFGDKEGLFREVLRRKMEERALWLASAPADPVDSLPYWFRLACGDTDWIRLLEWEALQRGEQKITDESHRQTNFTRALQRLRQLQADGRVCKQFNPGQLLLSMMALTAYPLAFPQVVRLVTGRDVSDKVFQAERVNFLRRFAACFQSGTAGNSGRSKTRAASGSSRHK